MGTDFVICSGSTHRFAIQGNWVIGLGHQRATGPVRQCPFDLFGIQAGEKFPIQGIRKAEETTGPNLTQIVSINLVVLFYQVRYHTSCLNFAVAHVLLLANQKSHRTNTKQSAKERSVGTIAHCYENPSDRGPQTSPVVPTRTSQSPGNHPKHHQSLGTGRHHSEFLFHQKTL